MLRAASSCSLIALLLIACGDDAVTQPSTSGGTTEGTQTTGGEPGSTSEPTTGTPPVTSTGETTDTASSTGGGTCAQGDIVCDGGTAKVCDGNGGFESEQPCDAVCAPDLGCVACVPGTGQCAGDVVQLCNQDGSGYADGPTCDGLLGLTGVEKVYSQGFALKTAPVVDFYLTRRFFLGAKIDFIFNFHKEVCSASGSTSGCQKTDDNNQASVHQMLIGVHLGTTF